MNVDLFGFNGLCKHGSFIQYALILRSRMFLKPFTEFFLRGKRAVFCVLDAVCYHF